MTRDLLLRVHSDGRYTVSEPYPRMREGEPAIDSRRVRWYGTVTSALATVEDWLRSESSEPPIEARGAVAEPRETSEPFDYRPCLLKPQAKTCIRLMRDNGGLTTREAIMAGIGRLSARVMEIRSVYGDDAVPKTWEKTADGRRFARYRWRGPDSVQGELEVA